MDDQRLDLNGDRKCTRRKQPMSEVLKFIRIFDVDIFALLFCFSVEVMAVTSIQLVQDKICINDFKLPPEVCVNIQERKDYRTQAAEIYKLSTTFSTYTTLVISIPGIFATLLLSRWLDSYQPHYIKYALIVPVIGNIVHVIANIYLTLNFKTGYMNLLWSSSAFGIAGGLGLFFSASFTHITRRSSPDRRPIRYGMIDLSMRIGKAISVSSGGFILFSKPWLTGQLRNYIGVFILSGLVSLLGGLWVLFMIKGDQRMVKKESNPENVEECRVDETNGDSRASSPFDLNNIRIMIRMCLKRRENNKHIQLWHLMACLTLTFMFFLGEMAITFQFVERAFGWSAKYFSNIKTVSTLLPAIGGVILPTILVKDDHRLGIIGSISIILKFSLKGGILKSFAYFFAEAFSISTSLLSISLHSIISKTVQPQEIGQIFTIISAIRSLGPIISSAFYTFVFNETLEVYPGFVYHLVAILTFYPLIFLVCMSLSC